MGPIRFTGESYQNCYWTLSSSGSGGGGDLVLIKMENFGLPFYPGHGLVCNAETPQNKEKKGCDWTVLEPGSGHI